MSAPLPLPDRSIIPSDHYNSVVRFLTTWTEQVNASGQNLVNVAALDCETLHVGGWAVDASAMAWLAGATNTNTPSTIVKRDASGNFAAGTITGNVTGSAGSVAWTGVTGRPTNVSAFANDAGYLTGLGDAVLGKSALATVGRVPKIGAAGSLAESPIAVGASGVVVGMTAIASSDMGATQIASLSLGYGAATGSWIQGFNGKPLLLNPLGNNVGINRTDATYMLHLSGGAYCNGTTWTNGSDAASKTGFADVNKNALLEKLATLPVREWSYIAEPGVRRIGPTSQDFRAAFGYGDNDCAIGTVEEIGLALAAIQALYARVKALEQAAAR